MSKNPPIRQITNDSSNEAIIQEAVHILKRGGVIVCATDTGYLLGVNGLNVEAVKKVYAIKGRDFNKPIHLVVANIDMARRLVEIDSQAETLFQHFFPGPLTLILKKKPLVPELLVSGLPGLGVRIPENAFLLELVKQAGCPITATSANRSGQATPFNVDEVLQELGDAVKHVDLIIDQQTTQHASPSTILDLTCHPPRVLRQGPIAEEMLSRFF